MTAPTAGWTIHWDASDTDNLWENTGDPGTVKPSDGDAVQQWDDEDDNYVGVYPTTTNQSPLYRATGMNSIGCLEFDGSNDVYATYDDTGVTQQTMDAFITNSAHTVVAAFTLESAASNNANVYDNGCLLADASQYYGIFFTTITGTHYVQAQIYDTASQVTAANGNSTISLSTTYVVQTRHASGTLYLSLDGGTENSVTADNIGDVTQNFFISRDDTTWDNFKVGEILIYNTNLGASNDAYTYMREKWINETSGVTIEVPNGPVW